MSGKRRVGIFGGMFDPVHAGHLDVLNAAWTGLGLTDLCVLPSNLPPHRPPPVASSYHRFAMVALAIAGRPGWHVSDIELSRAGSSYTIETLQRFHADGLTAKELFFLTGADAFLEIATWKDYPALLDAAHFVVVSRPGVHATDLPRRLPALATRMTSSAEPASSRSTLIFLLDAPTRDVSSTAIRQARRSGNSIAGLVPASVQQHIEQHGLYEDPALRDPTASSLNERPAGTLHGRD